MAGYARCSKTMAKDKDVRNMNADEQLLFAIMLAPYIGSICPICKRPLVREDMLKARFGWAPDVVHVDCWPVYERMFPATRTGKRKAKEWREGNES
jgi:hypothetical protein